MNKIIQEIESTYKKSKTSDIKSGDTVRVHQKIKEGNKERIQVFEGLVINVKRNKSLTSSITVRRIASGVGVEKSFLVHSPLVVKIEVIKRAKVRRKNLSYMRSRSGKSARLSSVNFDKDSVNIPADFDNAPEEVEEVSADSSDKPNAVEVKEEKVEDSKDKTDTTDKTSEDK